MQAHDAFFQSRRSDPDGIRVVPYRPGPPWPQHRARQRIHDPFRAFPYRAVYLTQIMYPAPRAQAHD